MSSAIEIIDPEGEQRNKVRRRVLLVALLIGLGIFGSPEARDYFSKWSALQTGRGVVEYLSALKTRAILTKKPMEARFFLPDRIEVYEASSCGPFAERKRVDEISLSSFVSGVEFAPANFVRDVAGNREAFLQRFCYDPLFGSSVFADGLAHGGLFLAHHSDLAARRADHLVEIYVEGGSGDLSLE